jgi:hypothetical protein
MERPKDAAGWAEFFKLREAKLQAARNRGQRERPREFHPADHIHPMILRLDNLPHELEAQRVVAERAEAARR